MMVRSQQIKEIENTATSTAQFFETSRNTEHCSIYMCHFGNLAKNQNPVTVWPEPDLWKWQVFLRIRNPVQP